MDLKLFVIIVTYKGKQWYDRCFTSLRESTVPVQTIVVDNASEDGSVEYIREHYPEIVLMENKENLGFGQANNLAMRYALDHDCDYVSNITFAGDVRIILDPCTFRLKMADWIMGTKC